MVRGYASGQSTDPDYEQICSGQSGHAEVVQVYYDPVKITYKELCEALFMMHDPTTLNRQGNDQGTQYRSTIMYHNDEQLKTATEVIDNLTA